jgi:hypothetical protein
VQKVKNKGTIPGFALPHFGVMELSTSSKSIKKRRNNRPGELGGFDEGQHSILCGTGTGLFAASTGMLLFLLRLVLPRNGLSRIHVFYL